jgi:hypothetical protein
LNVHYEMFVRSVFLRSSLDRVGSLTYSGSLLLAKG